MKNNKNQIFVIQALDESADIIYNSIRAAAASSKAIVARADTKTKYNSDLDTTTLSSIKDATLIIADISNANPNVMHEVGFARALNKPILLIADSGRNIPFDLAGIRIFIYESADSHEFIERLSKFITEALKNPEQFLFERLTADRAKNSNVFISYSHEDENFLDRLLIHLKPLERDGLIELWVDTYLRAGDNWKNEIEKALNRASVAILLVSADFLASDFITDNELPPLLKNAEEKGTRIVPLIVKPCRFTRDKNLRHFQALNDPKQSIVLLPYGERELLYDAVAMEVERSFKRS